MSRKIKVDENLFTIAKALTLSEKTLKEIQEITKLSPATLYRIHHASNYAAYRAVIAENSAYNAQRRAGARTPANSPENAHARTRKHTPAPAQAPTPARPRTRTPARAVASPAPANTYYGNTRLVELMIQQNKLLESISNKLAFIVEQLA